MSQSEPQVEAVEIEAGNVVQYLTFELAGEEYGVEILRVQGIQGWDDVTWIPNAPDYVLGVINLRGAIVPIVDLRRRFALEPITFGPTTVVIVLRIGGVESDRTVGVVVDAVSDVYRISENCIQPAPGFASTSRNNFVRGLATIEEKMVILVDLDQLLEGDLKELQVTEAAI